MALTLSQRLEFVFHEISKNVPIDIIVVIDGSTSVTKAQWEIMKECVRHILHLFTFDVNKVPTPVQMGFLQFTGSVYNIASLSNRQADLACALIGAQQKGGSTDATKALQAAYTILSAGVSRNKCIIILTDGDVGNASQYAANLLAAKWSIIVFGVGLKDSKKEAVAAVATPGHFFDIRNFDQLNDAMTHVVVKPSNPPVLELIHRASTKALFQLITTDDLTTVKGGCLQVLEESFLSNNTWNDICSGSLQIFVSNIKPSTKYRARGHIIYKNGKTSANSQEYVIKTLDLHPITKFFLSPINLHNEVMTRVLALRNWTSKYHDLNVNCLNILLMGRVGNGKSSLLNTFVSILSRKWRQVAVTRSSLLTATTSVNKHYLTQDIDDSSILSLEPNAKEADLPQLRNKWRGTRDALSVWDMYGWTDSNLHEEFRFLIEGALPDKWKEDTKLNTLKDLSSQLPGKVHAVILVCEIESVALQNEVDRICLFYKKLTDENIQPIIVLTKVDTVTEGINGDCTKVWDSGNVHARVSTFCQKTSIPQTNIFLVVNYTGPYSVPDLALEILALNILEAAINQASSVIDNIKRYYVQLLVDGIKPKLILFENGFDITVADARPFIYKELGQDFEGVIKDGVTVPKVDESKVRIRSCLSRDHSNLFVLKIMQIHTPTSPQPKPSTTNNAPVTTPNFPQTGKGDIVVWNEVLKESAGLLESVMYRTSLFGIRQLLEEQEIEIPIDDWVFVNADGQEVNKDDETTVQIFQCLKQVDSNSRTGFSIQKPVGLIISFFDITTQLSAGYLEGINLNLKLMDLRNAIESDLEFKPNFKLLTPKKDPLSKKQEESKLVRDVLYENDKKFIINIKQ